MARCFPAVLLAAFAPLASAGQSTPTQQVISMLTEMQMKGKKMMQDEQIVYAGYKKWARLETSRLGEEIEDGARSIESLTAFIMKADSEVAELADQISILDAEIGKFEAEKAEAAKIRETERQDFFKVSEDYSESLSALQSAIKTLSTQDYSRAQADMLLQQMSATIPGMPRVLSAFLQTKAGGAEPVDGAPAVAAYEFQSASILSMLKQLLDKFRTESRDAEKAEMNQEHNFGVAQIHLTNTIAGDKKDREERAVSKGRAAAASAKAKGELAETKAEKAENEKLKANMEATFATKTATFEQNQEVRGSELETLAKAIEIISGSDVSGSYSKRVNLVQAKGTNKVLSLLQLGRAARRSAAVQQASALLRERAQALGSKELASVAARVAANPFEKVISMVEDLLAKLKADATAEAEHKAWCDEELKANKQKRKTKTAQVNKLSAEIEGMQATIAEMGETIEVLAKEQAELAAGMSKATELRSVEKVENEAVVADAKVGFEAVGRALVILKEFYAGQAEASFLQQAPKLEKYKGMQGVKKGVIGMLEVIQSDFSRLRTETEAAESAAVREYDSFMADSEASKKAKHEREFRLSLDKDQVEYESGETQKDLDATSEELAQADKYYTYLKPSCVKANVNWEDRVARRKEEIAALREAYTILDNKSA